MSAQDDVKSAAEVMKTTGEGLTALATKLSALGIPAPVDTSALADASKALADGLAAVSAAVDAEAAKVAASPPVA